MKRIICLSMCGALLILGSCKNEFEPAPAGDSGNAIGFSIYREKQANTRVTLNDLASVQTSGFKLWGYVVDPAVNTTYDYIVNLGNAADVNPANTTPGRDVKYINNKWEYGTVGDGTSQAQWPTSPANFIAYAGVDPADLTTPPTPGSATSLKTLTYTVPAALASQKDLLVASRANVEKGTFNTQVPLNFTHALSGIAVKAKQAAAGQEVTVNSVSLLNLKQTGSLDMIARTWTVDASSKVSGAMQMTAAGVTINDAAPEADVVPATAPYVVLPQPTTLGKNIPAAEANDLTTAESEANLYLLVNWTFKDADGADKTRNTLCAVVSTGVTPITFAPNTLYTLNLSFDVASRVIVFNAPTVETWDTSKAAETVGPDKNVGIVLDGIGWAKTDLAAPKTFSASDLFAGYFYQPGRLVGWDGDESPIVGYDVDGNEVTSYQTGGTGTSWGAVNPCPDGWRLPTLAECNALYAAATSRTLVPQTNGRGVVELVMPANKGGGTLRLSVGGYLQGSSSAAPTWNKGSGTFGTGYYYTSNGTSLFAIAVTTAGAVSQQTTSNVSNAYEGDLVRCVKQVTQP